MVNTLYQRKNFPAFSGKSLFPLWQVLKISPSSGKAIPTFPGGVPMKSGGHFPDRPDPDLTTAERRVSGS
jgi:hypothetical protein